MNFPPEDIYFKKTIVFRHGRQELQFRVSQELFSSHQVDTGTRFLLRHVSPGGPLKFKKIFDLGCGYGPLGLMLKAISPESEVHLVDSDALAVDYTRQNAALNRLDVKVYPGLDYEGVTDTDFDLIVCNVPGKAGSAAIRHMLKQSWHYLAPQGEMAVVVVSPLEEACAAIIGADSNIRLIEHKKRTGYAIFHYAFRSHHGGRPPPRREITDQDLYFRGRAEFTAGEIRYTAETAYGLPEFDRLSYATELLSEGLEGLKNTPIGSAAVFNPGAGHLPVIVWRLFHPTGITLNDRSLLALRYSVKNLLFNGCPLEVIKSVHEAGIRSGGPKFDLAAGVLREEGGAAAVENIRQLELMLGENGKVLLSAGSTAITRIVEKLPDFSSLKIKQRRRSRGHSLLVLAR